jgi:murein tripeptide amidase MpaA
MRQQMRRRTITKADVEHALDNVISSWSTPENSVQYIGRSVDGRELKVWIVEPGLAAPRPTLKSTAWKGA